MSVQSTPQTYTCSYCEGDHAPQDTVEGSYCSHECYYRDKGQRALSQIKNDHRWCATCFRQVKTTWKPNKRLTIGPADHDQDVHYKDVFVGYQYATEHMESVIDEEDTTVFPRRQRHRWGCECGNIDLRTRDDILEDVEIDQLVARLYWCLDAFAAKGAIDHSPDRKALFDALRDEWRDWEYAIGRALYSTSYP